MADPTAPAPTDPTAAPAAAPTPVDGGGAPAADPAAPANADNSGMTRQELLQAAADNYLAWARTATTDEPPEGFNRQFARSDAYFAEVLKRRDAERAAAAAVTEAPVEAPAEPAAPAEPPVAEQQTPAEPTAPEPTTPA